MSYESSAAEPLGQESIFNDVDSVAQLEEALAMLHRVQPTAEPSTVAQPPITESMPPQAQPTAEQIPEMTPLVALVLSDPTVIALKESGMLTVYPNGSYVTHSLAAASAIEKTIAEKKRLFVQPGGQDTSKENSQDDILRALAVEGPEDDYDEFFEGFPGEKRHREHRMRHAVGSLLLGSLLAVSGAEATVFIVSGIEKVSEVPTKHPFDVFFSAGMDGVMYSNKFVAHTIEGK